MPKQTHPSEVTEDRPSRRYWTGQIIGWSIWCLVWMALMSQKTRLTFGLLLAGVLLASTFFALSHLLRQIIHRRGWLKLSVLQLSWRILLCSIGLAVLVQVIDDPILVYVLQVSTWEEELSRKYLLVYTVDGATAFYTWAVFHIGTTYVRVIRASEVERWRLEAALQAAELRALKSQVNPHFLFNCLNNLRSLVAEDPSRAREMILRLSKLLRYALEISSHEQVSLETELEIVRAYLDLESLQFEERLRWELEISSASRSALLPPLVLQHLVENAIKHGISRAPQGGTIRIRSMVEQGNLVLDVENTGQLASTTGVGTGLNNARERLRLLGGELAQLTITNRNAQSVAAIAVIPIS